MDIDYGPAVALPVLDGAQYHIQHDRLQLNAIAQEGPGRSRQPAWPSSATPTTHLLDRQPKLRETAFAAIIALLAVR
jgi:hypothetical protein